MPARAPLRVFRKLQGLANMNLLMKRTARPPVEAPRMVFTMARATTAPSSAPEMLPCTGGDIMMTRHDSYVHLGAAVEGEESKDQNKSAEASQRHGVSLYVVSLKCSVMRDLIK